MSGYAASKQKQKSQDRFKEQYQNNKNKVIKMILDKCMKTTIYKWGKENNIQKNVIQLILKENDHLTTFYTKCKDYKNPMFGISPSYKAGIGCKGWVHIDDEKVFFRSTLELLVFYYLYLNNIQFRLSKHRIPYILKSKKRTYNPDILINNTVYQIKPENLLNTQQNLCKFKQAKLYFKKMQLQFGIITQHSYNLYQVLDQVEQGIENGKIIFCTIKDRQKYYKYRRYYERKDSKDQLDRKIIE